MYAGEMKQEGYFYSYTYLYGHFLMKFKV